MENIIEIFILVLISIVFLQSGIDKIVDWKGNLGWLNGHFSQTFLKGQVPLALGLVTLLEILAGATAIIGIGEFILNQSSCFAMISALLSAVTLLILFFGQRIAKDYAGAQTLVIYFIPVLMLIYLLQN